ncbi:MAG: peptidoglycan-binding protein [Scytonema hyalinum WJT4-NPBG1]|jgi:peptidoglycan hydrolase-like protein with peptidoglycan-binding domain|nr:peptidoglycan-binding protein [Scytonema hyalinum WJT4-NPBG1]
MEFETQSSNQALAVCPATIKKGASGANVKLLQEKLTGFGFDTKVDGVFGDSTVKSVKLFQEHYGLVPDGIVGENTWRKLKVC